MDIAIRILAFAFGFLTVLLNKPLGKWTGSWQLLVMGTDFGHWANRIPYIIIGALAMIISVVAGS